MSNDTPASGKSEFMRGHPHIRAEGADVTRPDDAYILRAIFEMVYEGRVSNIPIPDITRAIYSYIYPFLKSR